MPWEEPDREHHLRGHRQLQPIGRGRHRHGDPEGHIAGQPLRSNIVALSGSGEAEGADIALAYTSPTTSPLHGVVTITNNGPLAANVTITVADTGSPCYITSIGYPLGWDGTQVSVCEYTYATQTAMASGSSAAIDLWYGFSGGTAVVTQSSQSDPNTANNSVTIPQFGVPGD